jgi:hypothetical protein
VRTVTPMIGGVLLAAATASLAAAPPSRLAIVPLGADAQVGCVRSADGPTIVVKRADGHDAFVSPEVLRARLAARIAYLRQALRALRGTGRRSAADVASRRAAIRAARDRLRALPACSSGALFDGAPPPSFALLCQHGFTAPTAAASPAECGVDLRGGAEAPWSVAGATAILDELLDAACTREGGIYYRRTTLDAALPLYHGVCARVGRAVVTDYSATARTLNMEQEPGAEDCIRRVLTAAKSGDPCGGYDPPKHGGGGGGGGGGSTPPSSSDCVILQMDQEPTGCE